MGFWDLFKTRKKDKMQETILGIQEKIFPGGQLQIIKELQEVRSLLKFEYTEEQIKSTYFYSATIFYLDKQKQQDNIVSSIISNSNNIIKKQDAIKIFEYLKNKFGISFIESIVSNSFNTNSKANSLLLLTKGGIVELKRNYKDITDHGKFEVILLNSAIALQAFQQANTTTYKNTEQDYLNLLISVANTYNINIPQNLLKQLIQSRITFYSNEIYQLFNSKDYKAYGSFYLIYIKPLSEKPIYANKLNETEYELFKQALIKMLFWIVNNSEKIID